MALLQQIGELLSRPPGSIVFHLLTLFALQVVLGLAYARWRREPDDEAARRMMIAAGGILVARLFLLLVGVYAGMDPQRPALYLPPLEQAINTATAVLLVWGLLPIAPERSRAADAILLGSLVVIGIMALFFLQDWRVRAATGIGYADTPQAVIWNILQTLVLLGGTAWAILDPQYRLTLRPFILGVPLLAHIAQQWLVPAATPLGSEPNALIRLGYLIAFPLWAVLAYHENISNLLTATEAEQGSAEQLTRTLRLGTSVIGTRIPQLRLEQGLDMITGLVPTQFATIGLTDEKNPQRVLFNHSRPLSSKDTSTQGWQVSLIERGALRLAYEQQRGLELLPGGVGARQVHELAQQFNTGPLGPVFVEPLIVASKCLGFLVLAAPPSVSAWSEQDRALVPNVAAFLAQAIANSRQLEDEIAARQTATAEVTEDREMAAELDRLNAELSDLRAKLADAEAAVRLVPSVAPVVVARSAAAENNRPEPTPVAIYSDPTEVEAGTEVTPVIEEAVTLVLPSIREKGLQLDLSLPAELPTVAIRREVLQQLVVSLLDNACRASAEDSSVLLRADLAAANGGSTAGSGANKRVLRITVADGGQGIRPEDQERVFDSNYYLSGGRPIQGLGDSSANMAVVQKLAEASGGNISLKSSEGQGTAFALSLPVTALYAGPTEPAKPAPGSSTKLLRQPVAESGS